MEHRTCSRCGGTYVASFFRLDRSANRRSANALAEQRRIVCKGCEQTAKDTDKQDRRWHTKARDTLRRHAAKYGMAPSEFARTYGWDVEIMAHEAEHGYSNGCPGCHRSFEGMGHGLADITLDIVDRDKPPFYRLCKWICQTCNREKGKTPSDEWAANLIAWDQWEKRQTDLIEKPYLGLPLLERIFGASPHSPCGEVVRRS
jgi:hypothetical protein